jgi:DNA-binding transcriptional regulator YhcF (GntR family)
VIVTRQGRGTFVAERADLSTELRHAELDGHLAAAVDVGRVLGLSEDDMTARLREAMARKDEGQS